jgi:organic hydroperoxide reductase OsmC/OhrA
MEPFPHFYKVGSTASTHGPVTLSSEGVVDLLSVAPKQFGGTGEHWSPEDLLVASVADCYIMSFKALAKASKLDWDSIQCDTVGKLDRIERTSKFTEFDLTVALAIPEQASRSMAERLLQKSKQICLITNSLSAECTLQAQITGGE